MVQTWKAWSETHSLSIWLCPLSNFFIFPLKVPLVFHTDSKPWSQLPFSCLLCLQQPGTKSCWIFPQNVSHICLLRFCPTAAIQVFISHLCSAIVADSAFPLSPFNLLSISGWYQYHSDIISVSENILCHPAQSKSVVPIAYQRLISPRTFIVFHNLFYPLLFYMSPHYYPTEASALGTQPYLPFMILWVLFNDFLCLNLPSPPSLN